MSFFFLLLLTCVTRLSSHTGLSKACKKCTSDREKVIRVGKLVEASMDQIKPNLSVLITGRIDGLFYLLLIVIAVVMSSLSSLESQFLVLQTVGVGLAYCQLFSHPLCLGLYNKEILDKLPIKFCYPIAKQNRVFVLNTLPWTVYCMDCHEFYCTYYQFTLLISLFVCLLFTSFGTYPTCRKIIKLIMQ